MKLSLSGPEKDPLTNLRLQKLLYYAQAWSNVNVFAATVTTLK